MMPDYRFSVIVTAPVMMHDEILDATDALGNAGGSDASIRGHANGMELLFERATDSLQGAVSSAISDVEPAGYRVSKVDRCSLKQLFRKGKGTFRMRQIM